MAGHVRGYCPMGCGRTLFADTAGSILCANTKCPRPNAVDDLLADRQTEHVVTFDDNGFTIRHPLRERLDDALLTCQLHAFCGQMTSHLPAVQTGTYRATWTNDQWRFKNLDTT